MDAIAQNADRPIVVAVFNQKGGVGKTTTAVNLAVCLALFGQRTLLVDLDSQGNASASLGLAGPPARGAYDLIAGSAGLAETSHPTVVENLWLCPSSDELAGVDIELEIGTEPHFHLRRALQAGGGGAAFVVVDCPPALGLLPVNALVAADHVLLVASPEPYAHAGLHKAWGHIGTIRSNLNKSMRVAGILLTMQEDTPTQAETAKAIRLEFGNRVLPGAVPRDARVVDASARNLPVVLFDPTCPAATAYFDLAERLLATSGGGRDRKAALAKARRLSETTAAAALPLAMGAEPLPSWVSDVSPGHPRRWWSLALVAFGLAVAAGAAAWFW